MSRHGVIPAQAGIQWGVATKWIPACAGMTPKAPQRARSGATVEAH
jgi:hypothetical protein